MFTIDRLLRRNGQLDMLIGLGGYVIVCTRMKAVLRQQQLCTFIVDAPILFGFRHGGVSVAIVPPMYSI